MNKSLALSLLCGVALFISACGGDSNSTESTVSNNTPDYHLQRSTNGADLLKTIKTTLLEQYGQNLSTDGSSGTVYETTSAADASGGIPAASTTNVQEAGVDEADRLKTDGQYLYAAAVDKPILMVFNADAQAEKITELTLDASEQHNALEGLYLRDKQLIALSSPYYYGVYPMPFIAGVALPYPGSATATTEVFNIDVATPARPAQKYKLQFDGELISSRMIGSILYLATRQTISLSGLTYPHNDEQVAANRTKINAAELSDFLPEYAINDVKQGKTFAANDCFATSYSNDANGLSLVSLLKVDTNAATPRPQGQCFLGDIETLYASTSAIYLATTSHQYDRDESGSAFYSGLVSTDLHRFTLEDNTVAYSGSGRVAGHLGWQQDLKPFRLSEYDETLRIITYTGDSISSNQSPAHLYNLQTNSGTGELEVVGELPNNHRPAALGKPGEQIYATRFAGERGYLVTFRLTDPLYVLDLSDPTDPFIVSELEIAGYSDYLHPVGENLLLGIGKDAVADTTGNTGVIPVEVAMDREPEVEVARGAWYQGVKLSLIDISNPWQPFETQKFILGKRGSETAVSRSHHAFTSLQQDNVFRFTVPLSRHETVNSRNVTDTYYPELPQFYYGWTQDELQRFEIDLNTGVMTQQSAMVAAQAPANGEYAYSAYGAEGRSVLIGDQVYYLHGNKVLSSVW